MMFGHGQRRRAAEQAAQRFAEHRDELLAVLGEQEARWRQRTPGCCRWHLLPAFWQSGRGPVANSGIWPAA